MAITKEAFLAKANQRKYKTVPIEGEEYRLREMSESDGCQYELKLMSSGKYDIEKSRRMMVAMMLVDDNDSLIVDDEQQLKPYGIGLINLLHDECLLLNRYQKDQIESLRKNSEPAPA
jgi:hypothetical protein